MATFIVTSQPSSPAPTPAPSSGTGAWAWVNDLGWKILVAIVAAVIVYFITERIKQRYHVVQLTGRNHKRYYHQFAEMYCDCIEPDQQISPAIIADHATDKKISPRSRRALRQMGRGTDRYPTAHQLFVAVQRRKILGFLCVLINLRRSYLFIAYLATRPPPDVPGDITMRLLLKAQRRISGVLSQDAFLFEVSPPITDSTSSRAKFRLFGEYGRRLGLATRRVPVTYVQPDMEPESLDGTTETLADLCITAAESHIESLNRDGYLRLVRSVYFDIYLKSFPDLELQPKYLEYLSNLYSIVAESK